MIICIILCFSIWCRDIKIKQFKFKKAWPFIAIGLPFTANSFLLNLSNNIDRWAVHLIFGAATLGTYAFTLNFASLGHMVLNMIQLYAGPRMLNKFGRTKNISIISLQCKKNCNIHSFHIWAWLNPNIHLISTSSRNLVPRIRYFYRVVQISLCWCSCFSYWVFRYHFQSDWKGSATSFDPAFNIDVLDYLLA